MVGAPFMNHNDFAQPTVLDPGSSEQFFRVITVYQPYTSVDYLQIEEFADDEEKPFLFLDSPNTVVTGSCTHV